MIYVEAIVVWKFRCPGNSAYRIGRIAFFRREKNPGIDEGLGKGVRSFKEGMNGIENDIKEDIPDKKENK